MSSMIESPIAETGPAGGAGPADEGAEPVDAGAGAATDEVGAAGCEAGAGTRLLAFGPDDGAVVGPTAATGLAVRLGPDRSATASPSNPSSRRTSPTAITRSSRLTLST